MRGQAHLGPPPPHGTAQPLSVCRGHSWPVARGDGAAERWPDGGPVTARWQHMLAGPTTRTNSPDLRPPLPSKRPPSPTGEPSPCHTGRAARPQARGRGPTSLLEPPLGSLLQGLSERLRWAVVTSVVPGVFLPRARPLGRSGTRVPPRGWGLGLHRGHPAPWRKMRRGARQGTSNWAQFANTQLRCTGSVCAT